MNKQTNTSTQLVKKNPCQTERFFSDGSTNAKRLESRHSAETELLMYKETWKYVCQLQHPAEDEKSNCLRGRHPAII